ncbi:CubicO group peptidase (beta-lactamase class C family) [Algoriphagus sp. 4150]|uniref:serine hydrolase domain-containing protein n=1 Tax=Algoriphagus sp. 4150 TaxID=2817756 RepID=UPI00285B4960|nr:serine hydrolase domain-containing protein [Algoriphagus sp. 4150]MDR7130605.1 CubicO group peptidase (beta-lactamase class C family) [Algoriphagus sp. 4150]
MKTIFNAILSAAFFFTSCNYGAKDSINSEIEEIEKSLITTIQIEGVPFEKHTLLDRMDHYNVPGLSIAVIKDRKLHWAKAYGLANDKIEVNTNTLFQAGSISKPLAALSVLKLVEDGILDLDEDVNSYLKNWEIPYNDFTKEQKVTLKRLLSHTSGLSGHGFPGYQRDESLPSLIQILNGGGNTPPIILDTIPGSMWRYSGGGYTLMEKIVEDVSGLNFEKVMDDKILKPLGMTKSTYEQPLPEVLALSASAAFDRKGEILDGKWNNYPEQAAAGLWTTPTELAKYCIEIQAILAGKEHGILSKATIEMMLTKSMNNWGLGPSLKGDNDSLMFGHGGKNEGFTTEMIAFAYKGDGVIIMTNADNGRPLINEIVLSISNYYGWKLDSPVMIELKQSDTEQLKKLAGKYRYNGEGGAVQAIEGEFVVEVKMENEGLKMIDKNGYFNTRLAQTGILEFTELDGGQVITFQQSDENNSYSFLYYDFFQFDKID